jgi:nucleoside-diphosphate-sugar epimerase
LPRNAVILVTGVAGFIGMHVALALLKQGRVVLGIDNLNDYYDVTLKQARLAQLLGTPIFSFYKLSWRMQKVSMIYGRLIRSNRWSIWQLKQASDTA